MLDETFLVWTVPSSPSSTMSVKVPPTSTPTRYVVMRMNSPRPTIADRRTAPNCGGSRARVAREPRGGTMAFGAIVPRRAVLGAAGAALARAAFGQGDERAAERRALVEQIGVGMRALAP